MQDALAALAADSAPLAAATADGLPAFLLTLLAALRYGIGMPQLAISCSSTLFAHSKTSSLDGSSVGPLAAQVAEEVVALLRSMWASPIWTAAVTTQLDAVSTALPALLAALPSASALLASRATGRALAALDVLGGQPAQPAVGSRFTGVDSAGMIMSVDVLAGTARVLVDGEEAVTTAQLHDINAQPLVAPVAGSAKLTPGLVAALVSLLADKPAGETAGDGAAVYGALHVRALHCVLALLDNETTAGQLTDAGAVAALLKLALPGVKDSAEDDGDDESAYTVADAELLSLVSWSQIAELAARKDPEEPAAADAEADADAVADADADAAGDGKVEEAAPEDVSVAVAEEVVAAAVAEDGGDAAAATAADGDAAKAAELVPVKASNHATYGDSTFVFCNTKRVAVGGLRVEVKTPMGEGLGGLFGDSDDEDEPGQAVSATAVVLAGDIYPTAAALQFSAFSEEAYAAFVADCADDADWQPCTRMELTTEGSIDIPLPSSAAPATFYILLTKEQGDTHVLPTTLLATEAAQQPVAVDEEARAAAELAQSLRDVHIVPADLVVPHAETVWRGEKLALVASRGSATADGPLSEWEGTWSYDKSSKPMALRLVESSDGSLSGTMQSRVMSASAEAIVWLQDRQGPDIVVEEEIGVTRSNSSGWGTQTTDIVSTAMRVTWEFDNPGTCLYVGVVSSTFSNFSTSLCTSNAFVMQADGYLYGNGSGCGNIASVGSGDVRHMEYDPVGGTLTVFSKEDEQLGQITGVPSEVRWAACFGGSNQHVRLLAQKAVADPWADLLLSVVGKREESTVTLEPAAVLRLAEGVKFPTIKSFTLQLADDGDSMAGTFETDHSPGKFELQRVTAPAPVVEVTTSDGNQPLHSGFLAVPLTQPTKLRPATDAAELTGSGTYDPKAGAAAAAAAAGEEAKEGSKAEEEEESDDESPMFGHLLSLSAEMEDVVPTVTQEPSLTWSPVLGPQVRLSNHGLTCRRDDEHGWGVQLVDCTMESGVTRVVLTLDELPDAENVQIGVVDRAALDCDAVDLSATLEGAAYAWTVAGTGAYTAGGESVGSRPALEAGAVITLTFDAEQRMLWLAVNDSAPRRFTKLPAAVVPAVCLGDVQKVTLSAPSRPLLLFRRGAGAPVTHLVALEQPAKTSLIGQLPAWSSASEPALSALIGGTVAWVAKRQPALQPSAMTNLGAGWQRGGEEESKGDDSNKQLLTWSAEAAGASATEGAAPGTSSALSNFALPTDLSAKPFYVEVDIEKMEGDALLTVGLAAGSTPLDGLIGWLPGSQAVRSSDGSTLSGSNGDAEDIAERGRPKHWGAPGFTAGATFGIGLTAGGTLFATVDGAMLGEASTLKPGEHFLALGAAGRPGAALQLSVNFGPQFQYSLPPGDGVQEQVTFIKNSSASSAMPDFFSVGVEDDNDDSSSSALAPQMLSDLKGSPRSSVTHVIVTAPSDRDGWTPAMLSAVGCRARLLADRGSLCNLRVLLPSTAVLLVADFPTKALLPAPAAKCLPDSLHSQLETDDDVSSALARVGASAAVRGRAYARRAVVQLLSAAADGGADKLALEVLADADKLRQLLAGWHLLQTNESGARREVITAAVVKLLRAVASGVGKLDAIMAVLGRELDDCLTRGRPPRVTEVVEETAHPHSNNEDWKRVVCIPGATSLRLLWAPECQSENGCDYLQVYSDASCTNLVQRLEGPRPRWVDLTVPGNTVGLHWHTDGSHVEWGWRVRIVPTGVSNTLPESHTQLPLLARGMWLLDCLVRADALTLLPQSAAQTLVRFLMLPGKTMEDLSAAVGALVAFARHVGIGCIAPQLTLLSRHLSDNMDVKASTLWQMPFVQRVLELLVEAEVLQRVDAPLELVPGVSAVSPAGGDAEEKKEEPADGGREEKTEEPAGADALTLVDFDFKNDSGPAPMRWDEDHLGPDIALSNDNFTVTRTNSSSYGVQRGDRWLTGSDTLSVEFTVDSHDGSSYLYIGLISPDFDNYATNLARNHAWSYECDGCNYSNGSSNSSTSRYGTGDVIRMDVDMSAREVIWYKNGEQKVQFDGLPDSVTVAASFGGSNQFVTMETLGASGGGGKKAPFLQKAATSLAEVLELRSLISAGAPTAAYPADLRRAAEKATTRAVQGCTSLHSKLTARGFELSRKSGDGTGTAFLGAAAASSGKWYFELLLQEGAHDFAVGVVDEEFKGSSTGKPGECVHSWVYAGGNSSAGEARHAGESRAMGTVVNDGNVLGIALDLDAHTLSLSFNGSSDAPWGEVSAELPAGRPLIPAVWLGDGDMKVRLRVQPASGDEGDDEAKLAAVFAHEPPAGFQPLGDVLAAMQAEMRTELNALEAAWTLEADVAVIKATSAIVRDLSTTVAKVPVCSYPWSAIQLANVCLRAHSRAGLASRLAMLLEINRTVGAVLSYLNWTDPSPDSVANRLRTLNDILLDSVREKVFMPILRATGTGDGGRLHVSVNRPRALAVAERRNTTAAAVSRTIVGQMTEQMLPKATSLRGDDRAFEVAFQGEGSIDAGGPYNEVISQMCSELHSPALPVLLRIGAKLSEDGSGGAAAAAAAEGEALFMPNPAATRSFEVNTLQVVGMLMAIAFRTKRPVDMNLAPLFWRRLVGGAVTLEDIEGVHPLAAKQISILRDLESNGLDESSFDDVFDELFVATRLDGVEVPLCSFGSSKKLTYGNRLEYAQLLFDFHASEFDAQIAHIRRGFGKIVPRMVLPFLSGSQLEVAVCGYAEIDVALLKATTSYSSGSPTDPHILIFWRVLEEEFSNSELVQFLRFVSGRSRLPTSPAEFARSNCHLDIAGMSVPSPDSYLPASHTCFFRIDLPCYSSVEVCAEKLRYAIATCGSIDTDNESSSRDNWAVEELLEEDGPTEEVEVYEDDDDDDDDEVDEEPGLF
eukprot:PLAT4426.7.p1 GENE.PLAT4426.7~~PLAT4426.7.p1  ORF type:complete len:3261 (+),score=1880.09 PLAT4426.7:1097-9784(+)